MKKLLVLLIALTGIALVSPLLAQPGSTSGGGPDLNPVKNRLATRSAAKGMMWLMRVYNPNTLTTLAGNVQSLITFPPKNRTPGAVRSAVLKTEQGEITIHLVPDWYLQDHKIALKAGDQLEVTGSKVSLASGQQPSVIVRDLNVGDKTVTLRDAKGVPIWLEGRISGPPVK
jgi:hypothetical protein